MSSSSSAPNGNNKQSGQPSQKKTKGNNYYSLVKNEDGNQKINIHSPANLPFNFTSSPAGRSVSANIQRLGAPPADLGDSEIRRNMPNFSRVLDQVAQNQAQMRIQQSHQPFLLQGQKPPYQQLVQKMPQMQQMQQQVRHDGNLGLFITGEGGASSAGFYMNTMKRSIDTMMSFNNFPYYLSERTKFHLIASCFLHMMSKEPNLQRPMQRVLLSGPEGSEFYQEKLAMALSHYYGIKLLVLDCHMNLSDLTVFGRQTSSDVLRFYLDLELAEYLKSEEQLSSSMDMPSSSGTIFESSAGKTAFSLLCGKAGTRTLKIGDRVIYTGLKNCSDGSKTVSRAPFGYRGRVMLIGHKLGVRFDMPISKGCDLGGVCEARHGFICDENEVCKDVEEDIKPIFSPFAGLSAESRLILFVKHAGNCLLENLDAFRGLNAMLNRLPDNVFVIGSHIQKKSAEQKEKEQKLLNIPKILLDTFPNKISIEMPKDQKLLDEMNCQLIRDAEMLQVSKNMAQLLHAITKNGLQCKDIERIHVPDLMLTDENAEEVVKWALGYDLSVNPQNYTFFQHVLSQESIRYALDKLRDVQADQNPATSPKDVGSKLLDVTIENEFEKSILQDVILHNDIGVKFEDIGALDNIKKELQELLFTFQMPELFSKGKLIKPCRGILLFGPPGTGKTMLAKAIATESGATFINVTASSITSKMVGESEKIVKAIFSLARKLAPTVVFIDEVDSLFGRRGHLEHESTRRVINEFMLNWDGLRTKDTDRVLVLAATNRPFDLDEAVIRRMPRRFMLNLPDVLNRSNILKVILAKEALADDIDFDLIAHMTEGFSGSDLMNLCVAAAHCTLREIMEKSENKSLKEKCADRRPINMQDFKNACGQVRASVSNNSRIMVELRQWNELHGAGGGSSSKK